MMKEDTEHEYLVRKRSKTEEVVSNVEIIKKFLANADIKKQLTRYVHPVKQDTT